MAFGQDGDIQVGCGIMAMVMVMFGVMVITTIGQDLFHIIGVCMILSIHFGDTMEVFIMDMDTDTIHTGDHIIHGIIIIPTEEVTIQIFLS